MTALLDNADFTFGEGVLQSPQDVAVIPHLSLIAVADDTNGIVCFSTSGAVVRRVEGVTARSLCHCALSNCLIVGDASEPVELHVVSTRDWTTKRRVAVPTRPAVRAEYTRWLAADARTADVFVAAGDNATAVLLRLRADEWRVVAERAGDLEHPCVVARVGQSAPVQLLLTVWDERAGWRVERWRVDEDARLLGQAEAVAPHEQAAGIVEPWAATSDAAGDAFVYDYKTGNVWKLRSPYWRVERLVGSVKCGQSVSLVSFGKWLYVSCEDEALLHRFPV